MKSALEVGKLLAGIQASGPLLKELGIKDSEFAVIMLKWVLEIPLDDKEKKLFPVGEKK